MRGRTLLLLAAVGLLAGCAGGAARPSGSRPAAPGPLPTGVFLAQYRYGSGDTGGGHGIFLSLFDQGSGKRLRDLVHLPQRSQVRLMGYARDGRGDVFYALGRPPDYRGNVNGGDPKPGRCGGTVHRVEARTGATQALFAVGADRTVVSPVPNPDGSAVAYLSQPCSAAFAQAVVVRDLASGRERRLSVSSGSAIAPSWSMDGTRLLFSVFFPTQHGEADAPGFVVAAARAGGQQPRTVVRHSPDPGCVVGRAAFDRAGIAIVEGCPTIVTAPARLVQLDAFGRHVLWRATTGLCPNGSTVLADSVGRRLLVTGTVVCGGDGVPVDVVQAWTGPAVSVLGRYTNPQQFVDAASW